MKRREAIKTTKEDIVKYWFSRIDESELSVDEAEALDHCWRCGSVHSLERCHIIPDALGGIDAPENLVLLCKRCHAEGPNVRDSEIMWDWLKAYKIPLYDAFWSSRGMKEYQFIYGHSVEEEIKSLSANDEKLNLELFEIMKSVSEEASIHFGQPYFNSGTIAGIFRMTLKEFAQRHSMTLLPRINKDSPWWL